MNPCLSSALKYAQSNYKVFPLKSNSKNGQVVASWKQDASTNPDLIHQWFDHSDYNLGVVTGHKLVVIDVDNKNQELGNKTIKKYMRQFPQTRIVRTPNNGFHIYYKVNRPIRSRVGLYPGIDIRGEGGYVLGVGSKINGKFYQDVNKNVDIAFANDKVYEFLNGNRQKSIKRSDKVESIHQGQRNDYLFRIACFLQQKGLSDEAIHECIIKENEMRCDPILNAEEVEKIIQSSFRYKKGKFELRNEREYEGSYTLKQLYESKDVDEEDIVEDMISVGLTLIGAPQKTGKTFFGLQLCDAISEGKDFLGKKVQKGTALYLAFEDKKVNIRKRLKHMQIQPKENFIIDILKPDPLYDLEARIEKGLQVNSDLKIVVVDTFQKIRRNKERDYDNEYDETTAYHELAYKYHIAIVLITHVKKEIDTNHPFDSIYGSRGLTAGSDSILVMYKKNHLSDTRQLAIQGKDIPDDEITLRQNENMVLEITDEDVDNNHDENLIKVVNYIVRKKEFVGSHEELSSLLSLALTGKQLQVLLAKNEDLLKTTFISYEKRPRTNKARMICLRYHGNEEI